ncbi:ABC transporter substrate-binding protein [Nocardiopsis sp. RSe5-2]|uniref:ABC transporter substrate-binding protein n=1 Tax=Nocardiopsis endophytica TaxID=3018445 RepID=A0ABT4U7U7_9ACTN|nr:ABC transporter substrate-binding protein [Nocardiopsis endophytica]MDA2813033.1 ABC transporter substrate-binding protein [Nocardiopsis endophytica]
MTEHAWRLRGGVAVAAAGALLAAGCAPGDGGAPGGGDLQGVQLKVAAKWTGVEQDNFVEVLSAFEEETGATVEYEPTGEDTGAYLGPKIEAGEPPDVALLPQPGLLEEYAAQDALVPLSGDAAAALEENYTDYWSDLGSVDGEPYGILLKAAHKSIVWYRPEAFDAAGVQPPQTWDDMVGTTASTLSDAGETPFAMCGASGWTLTDWFENVYLSQAGPDKYDQLTAHEIPWTDDSVVDALETMAEVWGEGDYMAGGTDGAVQTDFPTCVTQVYGQQDAAMVYEADFVAASAAEAGATVGDTAQAFPFPAVGDAAPVVVGGDIAVAMSENEGTQELLAYLASPEAQTTWAGLGGYLSANSQVQPDAYTDEFTQQLSQTVLDAGEDVRYDMSDQVPSQFGATEGRGMWAVLQDFLRDPGDPEATAQELEDAAQEAY